MHVINGGRHLINNTININFFEKLDSNTIKEILNISTIKEYKKGDMLFSEKEKLKYIYFIIQGVVSIYKPNKNDDGKKVLFILGNGEILNKTILDNEPSAVSCEFLTEAKVLIAKRDEFEKIMQNNFNLCQTIILSLISREKKMIHQLKNSLQSLTVDRQLAFKLWKLAKDFGYITEQGLEIGFDLSITYLAEILGNKRETVSRQLKILSNKSLVETYKKRFIIKNLDGLYNYYMFKE